MRQATTKETKMSTATAQPTYADYLRYCEYAKVDPYPRDGFEGTSINAVMVRRIVAQWVAKNAEEIG